MKSTELKARIQDLAEQAKDCDPHAAIVLLTLAGSLSFYGASGLAVACQDHAREMLGRIAQLRRETTGS